MRMAQRLKMIEVKSFPQIMTWVECFSHDDEDGRAQNLSYTFVQVWAGGCNQDATAVRKNILKGFRKFCSWEPGSQEDGGPGAEQTVGF